MNIFVTTNQKKGAGKAAKWLLIAFDIAELGLRKPAPAKPSQQ